MDFKPKSKAILELRSWHEERMATKGKCGESHSGGTNPWGDFDLVHPWRRHAGAQGSSETTQRVTRIPGEAGESEEGRRTFLRGGSL